MQICNEWGHKSNTCPRRRELNYVDGKRKDIMKEDGSDSDDQFDDGAPPNEGHQLSYLVHRNFHIPHTECMIEN